MLNNFKNQKNKKTIVKNYVKQNYKILKLLF